VPPRPADPDGRGFTVHEAGTGNEAVAVLRRQPAIRAALVDVNMPGMSGPATLTALRAVRPGLAVAFMTGGSVHLRDEELLALGAEALVCKPFQMADLLEAVGNLVGAGAVVSGG
jgi:CheY-like chemotaxis protein